MKVSYDVEKKVEIIRFSHPKSMIFLKCLGKHLY